MKIFNMLLTLALFTCGAAAQEPAKAAAEDAWKSRTFTAEELKKYNGKDGAAAYVAVDGIVYDFSKSKSWKGGKHMMLHTAGADLSSALHNKAPKVIHKDGKILEKMPKVGVLAGYNQEKTAAAPPAEEAKPAAAPMPAEQRPVAAPPAAEAAPAAPAAAPQPAAKAPLAAMHKVAKEELGLETACPVTGEKLKVTEKTPALDFKGKTYYFSSLSSLQKFSKDPVKLLKDRAGALFKKKKS